MDEFLREGGDPKEDEYTEDRNPGDMHEPKPYTGELDWHDDGSELVHPFID